MRDQRLDPRRDEGHARRPGRPEGTADGFARRRLRRAARPGPNLDAVEGKLFGLGCESYTVGSHEFYLGYAMSRRDALHARHRPLPSDRNHHRQDQRGPMFLPEILLHVSRGVRWDSDHVVVLGDDLEAIAQELVRGDFLRSTHIGLDYFDASINRVAAWVIGTRNTLKALLKALVEPTARLRECEAAGDYTARLALQEEIKALPWGAVWDHYCATAGVPGGAAVARRGQRVRARRDVGADLSHAHHPVRTRRRA